MYQAMNYALEAGAGRGEALRFGEWREQYLPNVACSLAWHAWIDATPVHARLVEV